MMEIQYIVQGGSVGVALVSLWVIYKLATNHSVHLERCAEKMTEAMDRNTTAWVENARALQGLMDKIK